MLLKDMLSLNYDSMELGRYKGRYLSQNVDRSIWWSEKPTTARDPITGRNNMYLGLYPTMYRLDVLACDQPTATVSVGDLRRETGGTEEMKLKDVIAENQVKISERISAKNLVAGWLTQNSVGYLLWHKRFAASPSDYLYSDAVIGRFHVAEDWETAVIPMEDCDFPDQCKIRDLLIAIASKHGVGVALDVEAEMKKLGYNVGCKLW